MLAVYHRLQPQGHGLWLGVFLLPCTSLPATHRSTGPAPMAGRQQEEGRYHGTRGPAGSPATAQAPEPEAGVGAGDIQAGAGAGAGAGP